VLALPWTERSNDSFDIEATRRILDQDHYGLEGIKERIIEFLLYANCASSSLSAVDSQNERDRGKFSALSVHRRW